MLPSACIPCLRKGLPCFGRKTYEATSSGWSVLRACNAERYVLNNYKLPLLSTMSQSWWAHSHHQMRLVPQGRSPSPSNGSASAQTSGPRALQQENPMGPSRHSLANTATRQHVKQHPPLVTPRHTCNRGLRYVSLTSSRRCCDRKTNAHSHSRRKPHAVYMKAWKSWAS